MMIAYLNSYFDLNLEEELMRKKVK